MLETSEKDLEKLVGQKLSNLIIKNRESKIKVKPGYDGEYGVPEI
jgi:PHP family Zn ribbon phosphoesterase